MHHTPHFAGSHPKPPSHSSHGSSRRRLLVRFAVVLGLLVVTLLIADRWLDVHARTCLAFSDTFCDRSGLFVEWDLLPSGPFGVHRISDPAGRAHVLVEQVGRDWHITRFDSRRRQLERTIVVLGEKGTAVRSTTYNEHGRLIRERIMDCRDSQECTSELRGEGNAVSTLPCAKISWRRFAGRLNEEDTCLGFDGRPRPNDQGVTVSRFEASALGPNIGFVEVASNFDAAMQPVRANSGCHRELYRRNAFGCLVRYECQDETGKPASNSDGVYAVAYETNETCDQVSAESYSADSQRIADNYGVHRYERKYSNGAVEKESRYDAELKPVRSLSDGAHVVRFAYDNQGHLLLTTYYSLDDAKISSTFGYHAEHRTYTAGGLLETLYYLDVDDRPVRSTAKVHKKFFAYDAKGQVVLQSFFDDTGKPTIDAVNQVFVEKTAYDADGRVTEVTYWQNEKEPMNRWSGVHGYHYKYDDVGRRTGQVSLGLDERPAKETTGVDETRFAYDDNGALHEIAYYAETLPVVIEGAQVGEYHKLSIGRDAIGRVADIRYFGVGGSPVDAVISGSGVHRVQFVWKGMTVVEQRFFGAGSSVPSRTLNCLKEECLRDRGNGLEKR